METLRLCVVTFIMNNRSCCCFQTPCCMLLGCLHRDSSHGPALTSNSSASRPCHHNDPKCFTVHLVTSLLSNGTRFVKRQSLLCLPVCANHPVPTPTTICLVSANDTGCIKGTEEADGGRGGGGCTGGVQVVVLALVAKLLRLKLKCLSR